MVRMLDAFEPLLGGALAGPSMSVGVPLPSGLQISLADGRRLSGGRSRQAQHVQVPSEDLICAPYSGCLRHASSVVICSQNDP